MSKHLISTPAVAARCRACYRPVLSALDSGLPAVVDPAPVDAAGEVAALAAGRWTYARLVGGGLVHRDAGQIVAGMGGVAVHAEHRCPVAAGGRS